MSVGIHWVYWHTIIKYNRIDYTLNVSHFYIFLCEHILLFEYYENNTSIKYMIEVTITVVH